MQEIIQMCNFDGTKSTKGASKMRRDMINSEISQLRDLLPLPPSTRQRLSQLQLMALVCVYVRKSNYFQQVFKQQDLTLTPAPTIGFSKAMSGFLMMVTQGGKLLYISDNAAEYLGHSMEDLLIHGDSVYDIIDKADHAAVQAELVRGSQAAAAAAAATTSTTPPEALDGDRLFLCRMNVSRNARRQMRFGDQKVVLVQGKYLSYLPLCSRNEPVFLARCTPVAMPETRECVVQGATNVFTSVHTLDMKFINLDKNGEFYLGYSRSSLAGVSWYHLIHPENMKEAQTKHRLITASEQDRSCILLLRLQVAGGTWRWVHCVLQVKDASDSTAPASGTNPAQPGTSTAQQTPPAQQQPVIVATNQVLSEREAQVLRGNSWLYHYYTMQSKLQYGLTYDTQAHAQRVAAYYPQVMGYQSDPASTYMSPASLNGGHSYTHSHAHAGHSAYSQITPSAYAHLQHYHHHYSVRLQHGLDYSSHPAWGTYDTSHTTHTPATHTPNLTTLQPSTQTVVQAHTPSPKSLKRPASSPTSPRRSASSSPRQPAYSPRQSTGTTPMSSMHNTSGDSGGVALATPVAVRATPFGVHKGTSSSPELEHLDNTWKQSPTQEVPEYPEYSPFITPPYSAGAATPTKNYVFNFDTTHHVDSQGRDQQVPSVDTGDFTSWATNSFGKAWLPILDETTTPLRALHHAAI